MTMMNGQGDMARRVPGWYLGACAALGAAVLLAAVMGRFFQAHNYQDFPQFYMAGVIARHGAWEALYPVPIPGSDRNAGEADTSTMRPEYARLASAAGVPDTLRCILPPPAALLCWPLGYLPYWTAHVLWTVMSVGFGVVVAWQAGAVYARLAGRPTVMQGLIILAVAASPNMYQSCRMGQSSTLVGACLGAVMLALGRPEGTGAGAGFALSLATLFKYIGAILAPLVLAMRRWGTLLWSAGIGIASILVSLAVMGREPWRQWLTEVAPTLGHSHPWNANQSAYGLAVRLSGTNPPPAAISAGLKAGALVVMAVVLGLIFTRPRRAWERPAVVFAAAAALLAWTHVFSPIFWNHYYPYLFPLWGWLAWEATRSRAMAAAVIAVFALAWAPIGIVPSIMNRLPEVLRTHMLWSAAGMLGIAAWRLWRPAPQGPPGAG